MNTRFLSICAVTIAIRYVSAEGTVLAQSSSATVDQVLATLAEVVKDRATQVASQSIKDRLLDDLCAGKPLTVNHATMHVGGSKGNNSCQASKANCTSDDIFPESCRLIRDDDTMPLTDTHFLKELGREATLFAIRLAGAGLTQPQFDQERLNYLGGYLFDVMQDMGASQPDIDAIAERTLSFANAFGQDTLPSNVLTQVEGLPELKALRTALQKLSVASACGKGKDQDPSCISLTQGWTTAASTNCTTGSASTDGQALAAKAFDALFGPKGSFKNARSQSCGPLADCNQAELLIRFEPALHRFSCPAQTDSAGALRQLVYDILEKDIYLSAIKQQNDAAASKAADDFVAALRRIALPGVRREEVARGIRVVASAIRAFADDGPQAKAWFSSLKDDVHGLQLSAPFSLDDWNSLKWENRKTLDAPVALLRDAVKDFLTLPLLEGYVAGVTGAIPGLQDAVSSLVQIVDAFDLAATEKPSAEQTVKLIADVMTSLASMRSEIEKAATAAGVKIPTDPFLPEVLSSAADLLHDSYNRDWVALAFKISETLDQQNLVSLPSETTRSIHFVRVLMSMYQAQSPAEAKGVFEAELEDVSSRRQRWSQLSIDAGALLGGGAGTLWTSTMTTTGSHFQYGLFAPFGVQVAWKALGLMVYPVDLGAYLVGQTNSQTAPSPNWHDSLRMGAAGYLRFSANIPVDIGIDVDYHPAFSAGLAETRVMGMAVLELPLYLIH